MEDRDDCDITDSVAVSKDNEQCSAGTATENHSNKDVSILGSWKFKEENVEEKCDDNATENKMCEDSCSETYRTEGRNVEFRAGEKSIACSVQVKGEEKHSPNIFINDSEELGQLVDLEMEVEEEEDAPQDDLNSLECEMCDEIFPCQEDLEEHFITHAGSTLYRCTKCQRWFPCAEYMKNHMKMHENKQDLQCAVCKEQFNQEETLHEHRAVHSGSLKCELNDENWNHGTQRNQLLNVKTFNGTGSRNICLSGKELNVHEEIHETDQHPCQICDKKFTRENLITHMVQHSEVLTYICRVCKLVFTKRSDLDNHMHRKHSEDAIMLCGFCQNFASRRSDLDEHLKSHVKKVYKLRESTGKPYSLKTSMERFFACGSCEKSFIFELELLTHMKDHCTKISLHQNVVSINKRQPHSTSEVPPCSQSAVDRQTQNTRTKTQDMILKIPIVKQGNKLPTRILLLKQSDKFPTSVLVPKQVNQSRVKTGLTLRTANIHHSDKKSQNMLLKVVNSSSGNVVVPVTQPSEKQDGGTSNLNINPTFNIRQPGMLISQVKKCDIPVDSEPSFPGTAQKILTNPKPQQPEVNDNIPPPSLNYECSMCKKDLHTTIRLYEHIAEHDHYICYCGEHLDAKSALHKHIYHHKKKHIHQCEICGKTFHRLSRLKPHIKSHNRDYKCEECGKTFSWPNCLNKHMLIHKGKKPFVCVKCGMAFNVHSVLTRHEKTHTDQKPFECNVCCKRFRVRDNLQVHMRVHTGEKPYQCERCGLAFNHNVSLKTHLKKYHSEET